MVPKLKYFGTSGIRGRTLIDLTPNFAERMARAYADVVLSGIDQAVVVIGRDPRFGSETLEMAIIAGLTGCGVSVIQCGIIPTPVLLTYQRHISADGAVMITGSHIPPNRNGLIFMNSDGSYCSDHIAFQIEQRFEFFSDRDGLINVETLEDLQHIGSIKSVSDAWDVYYKFIEAFIDLSLIKSYSKRIIIDPCNGTASKYFSAYLKNLGLNIEAINDKYLAIPARLSEPIDENLLELKMRLNSKEELGTAFDVDADRVTFVIKTPDKNFTVPADYMGALILDSLLEKGVRGKTILPINSSMLIETILDQYQLKPLYCKIGQPGTIEAVKKEPNPIFSYEESGKFYFLHDGLLWTDGPLMVMKVIELLSKTKKSLYNLLVDKLNDNMEYISISKKVVVDDETIKLFKLHLPQQLEKINFPNEVNRIYVDGIRINFNDNSWLLLRASGTEPKIRLVANAKNKSRALELINIGQKTLSDILEKLGFQSNR